MFELLKEKNTGMKLKFELIIFGNRYLFGMLCYPRYVHLDNWTAL